MNLRTKSFILEDDKYGSSLKMQKGGEMSVNKSQSLQDAYLNRLRKDKVPVVVYLTNGIRLKGVIKGFDSFVVLLKGSSPQLIYKHAISTILPEKDVEPETE